MSRSMNSFYDGSRACRRLGSRMGEYFEVKEEETRKGEEKDAHGEALASRKGKTGYSRITNKSRNCTRNIII